MSRRRALMTDRERELIAKTEEADEDLRYQAISRVRRKIKEELSEDVQILEAHHEELLKELQEIVCEEIPDTLDDH